MSEHHADVHPDDQIGVLRSDCAACRRAVDDMKRELLADPEFVESMRRLIDRERGTG